LFALRCNLYVFALLVCLCCGIAALEFQRLPGPPRRHHGDGLAVGFASEEPALQPVDDTLVAESDEPGTAVNGLYEADEDVINTQFDHRGGLGPPTLVSEAPDQIALARRSVKGSELWPSTATLFGLSAAYLHLHWMPQSLESLEASTHLST